jgi:fructose-bisphosphate aldolase, class I
MDLGKMVRIQRIFSHPSGRLCSVAIDHFIGYQAGLPPGLSRMADAVAKLMAAQPDAITMLKGVAKSVWPAYAGRIPFIVSTVAFTPDDAVIEQFATPREALQLGADAIAVAIGVRGPNEGRYLKILNSIVEEADRLSLPVFSHIYPRDFSGVPKIVHDPENIMWAVRCGIECGADVIKVPFTGDVASYRDIVASSPVPVVAAGGPKVSRLEDALAMASQVVAAGARGAVIGRNIWGEADPTRALLAFKAVIHDNVAADKALKAGA